MLVNFCESIKCEGGENSQFTISRFLQLKPVLWYICTIYMHTVTHTHTHTQTHIWKIWEGFVNSHVIHSVPHNPMPHVVVQHSSHLKATPKKIKGFGKIWSTESSPYTYTARKDDIVSGLGRAFTQM